MRKNKKIILLVALSGFLVTTLISCAGREIRNINTGGTNIICFGDSITFGHGVDSNENYPAYLAKMTGLAIINAGIDGDNSAGGLQRIDSDVLERNPLLVIIEFGGNDFMQKVALEETVNNIKMMVDKIQARGAMVAIVDINAGIILNEYRSAFSNIAFEKRAIFLPDVLSGILTNASLKSDYIHPNNVGYKIIAHRIYRAIMPYINQNTLSKKFKK